MDRKSLEKLREKKRAAAVLFAVLLNFSLFSGPSWADEGTEGTDPYGTTQELECITVTANKIEEDVTDVPQSITVIDEKLLEEKGIRNVSDLIREIPNMSSGSSPIAKNVSFRGLNSSSFTYNNPVVIYVDGVAHIGVEGFDASLVNVERVEVLRGPQGTMYGKDAIGAVINIVTKKTDNAWHGKALIEYGDENFVRGAFNVGGAVRQNRLYLDLNGQYTQDDGWIENENPDREDEFNRENDRRFNLKLTATPTDRFTAHLSLTNEYSREYGVDGLGVPSAMDIDDFSRDDAEHVDFDVLTKQTTENNAQSLALTYDFDSCTLDSVTTHKVLKFDATYDSDFGDNALYDGLTQFWDYEDENWTQELRLSSAADYGFRWVTGLYCEDQDIDQPRLGQQFPLYDSTGSTYLGDFEMNSESRSDAETLAAFGQITIPLAETVELTLGGRYQRIEKEIDLSMYYLPVGASGPSMFDFNAEKGWNAFLPKAALSWRLSDNWSTYVSYSEGYMPGGFNYFAMAGNKEDNSFDPQRSFNYEWGIKGVFERGSIAMSVFYMDIEDIHVYKVVDMGTMYVTDNAEKAHSQGVELEATYRLFNGLELSVAAGLIDAEYDDYDTGIGNFDGQNIAWTPSHTLRAGAVYTHPSGFYARVDVLNLGKQYFYDNENMEFPSQDDYTLVDGKIGYRIKDWDLYVYGRNLTDEEYITGFSSMRVLAYGDPRTYGAGLRYTF